METSRTGREEERVVDDRGCTFADVERRFPATASGFLIAPLLWFAYFISIYALQGAGCALGLDRVSVAGVGLLQLVLLGVTAAAATVMLLSGAWAFRSWQRLQKHEREQRQALRPASFLAYGALLHAGLFFVAVLWSGVPIVLLESCGPRLGG